MRLKYIDPSINVPMINTIHLAILLSWKKINTLKEKTFVEKTFVSGKIREIFGMNFRELAVFAFLVKINFHEFMI